MGDSEYECESDKETETGSADISRSQVCYSSGWGYYIQDGEYLECQNCGNRFTANEVEVSAGGCNPYPIFEEDKTVAEDSIEISYDFLKEAKEIFANWKME